MNDELKHIAHRIRSVANRLVFLEKRSILKHEGIKLHPSEIHLMQAIHQHPEANAGEMAQWLGVTLGAVSQTLSRLEKKGVIEKQRDPSRKNEVSVSFTRLGQEVLDRFHRDRASAMAEFAGYLESLDENDRRAVTSFLSQWEDFLGELG